MTAGIYDIIIEQGATFTLPLTWNTNGVPVNLTGYTARMMCRESFDSETPFLTLTTENGGIALGGALGTIDILATAAQTAALTKLVGVYDLELVAPGGQVYRKLQGSVTVSREVTR